ncbi:U-box domain-containing protein 35 isoform X4 [Glycine max]|uniref:U-box domain-containing protein 35 isoform X4 n=1 Tax=Glycine max TaxID=3847 RepID=UPI001B357130|nr:U-box domain-containing protein 35 isoform X4 [Glycine max]
MWLPGTKTASIIKKGGGNGLVAVAIEKDNKGSRHALKWAADTLLSRGQTLVLIHVLHTTSPSHEAIICNINTNSPAASPHVNITKDLFRTFHCYCSRKDIQCLDVLLEDMDVVKGITEYVSYAAIENLVLGQASRHGFIRFKSSTPSNILKGAPDFCTVYVISKGRISSVRSAARTAPHASPLLRHIQILHDENARESEISSKYNRASIKPSSWQSESMKRINLSGRSCMDFPESDSDISFVSSERPSSVRSSSVFYDYFDLHARNPRTSTSSDHSLGSTRMRPKFSDLSSTDISFSEDSRRSSVSSSLLNDEAEADMRSLKLELKHTLEIYTTACRETLAAQQKLGELQNWKIEEEKKMEEMQLSQEAAEASVEQEKARSKAARETAKAAKRIARVESSKRESVKVKALKEAEEMRKQLDNLTQNDKRYRRYTIEEIERATDMFSEARKIGEGGYGPVYKCYLDHTQVAVKVLRQDSAQGEAQFQQEVNILGCIRHPNMVLLIGACAEHGILVYEYMAKGSLEDCMFGKKKEKEGKMRSWKVRFGIAAEIATGLLFLHQTKPEPLVHRDLKPGNILLDQNYVSKISDVGLAKLVPAATAGNGTQCCMTAAAGTFCYIDPEYQQTGMLGVKSDVYSLGIILLQLLTGRPAMGLAHQVEESIKKDRFGEMLDPSVPDWPLEQALCLANLALQCAQLRRKDRPDLATLVLPRLQILRDFASLHSSTSSDQGPNDH